MKNQPSGPRGPSRRKVLGYAIAAIVAAVALFVINPTYTVNVGEEAVIKSFGNITRTDTAGLHFLLPLVDSYTIVSTQSHSEEFPLTKDKMGNAYSKDQQPADIVISVNYHVVPGKSAAIVAEYGGLDNFEARELRQKVPATFKAVFGTYDAQSAVQNRAKLGTDTLAALQETVTTNVVVESVQVKNIQYSQDYEDAIAAKQKATVEVQTKEQELAKQQVDAKIAVTQAQAVADSNLAKATADAKAIELKGNAEAFAIKAKSDALASNPALVEYTKAAAWNGVLPTTMLPDGALPFLDVKPAGAQ